MCILSLNEKQYLQQKERYKDHAQNAQNISTICLQNTYKQVAQSVKIICTRYRNQVQCFQIISYDLLLCEQNCTNGWELDDHRFQSKLVIIPFFIFSYCGRMAEAMGNILQNIPFIGSGRF